MAVYARPGPCTAARLKDYLAFASGVGAVPKVMDPDAHDRLVAFLSHLPQLTASALMHVVGDEVGEEGLQLAGRGLADTTRLASSPARIWRDISATNADHVGEALDLLIADAEGAARRSDDGRRPRADLRVRRRLEGEDAWTIQMPGAISVMPTRTYLELTRAEDLRRAAAPLDQISVHQVDNCAPSFWRRLYSEVGSQYHWVDRLAGRTTRSARTSRTPRCHCGSCRSMAAWQATSSCADADDSVEIAYFGLLPWFVGRGLGNTC